MKQFDNQIDTEQGVANQKKAIIPNLARLLGNLSIYYLIPDELPLFKNISFGILLYSIVWLCLEYFFVFNYKKFKFLPYLPATSDLIAVFILIYLTGGGNSTFTGILICLIVISTLFSPDTFQAKYLIYVSLLLYFLLLLGTYSELFPYVNYLNFEKNRNLFTYFISFFLLLLTVYGLYNSIKFIVQANLELNLKLKEMVNLSEIEKNRSEKLLLNILPSKVAEELKDNGFVQPVLYENVTILFTDFHGFTKIAETMSPKDLIKTLDTSFRKFDQVIEKFNLEKLKTIGDSYMCAGGLPVKNNTHPIDACLAALELKIFMKEIKNLKDSLGFEFWDLRIGIHSGPVIAGVIGEKKFAYDIWGDAVNTASRLESSGAIGEVNISQTVFDRVKDFFICEYRGKISAKNKGFVDMYFLKQIRPELSLDGLGITPNDTFLNLYNSLRK